MAHYPVKHYLWTENLMLEVLHGVIRLVHGFDSFIGMPWKFRLSVHRKNEFRKRRAECVVASNQEDDHTLPVSIPLDSLESVHRLSMVSLSAESFTTYSYLWNGIKVRNSSDSHSSSMSALLS